MKFPLITTGYIIQIGDCYLMDYEYDRERYYFTDRIERARIYTFRVDLSETHAIGARDKAVEYGDLPESYRDAPIRVHKCQTTICE